MSANLETIIGDVHDIARDPQRNHMFIIYQMENELVVKQLYHNVEIYSHDFKAELFECKTTFSIIFILFCRQSKSHYFSSHEICTNFAPLRRSCRTLEKSQGRNIYYQDNTEKINSANSARYKQKALVEREIPDGLSSPAPTLPPVPKVAACQKKKAERKAKKKAKEQEKLLSQGRGRGWGRGRGRGRGV